MPKSRCDDKWEQWEEEVGKALFEMKSTDHVEPGKEIKNYWVFMPSFLHLFFFSPIRIISGRSVLLSIVARVPHDLFHRGPRRQRRAHRCRSGTASHLRTAAPTLPRPQGSFAGLKCPLITQRLLKCTGGVAVWRPYRLLVYFPSGGERDIIYLICALFVNNISLSVEIPKSKKIGLSHFHQLDYVACWRKRKEMWEVVNCNNGRIKEKID